MTNADPAIPTVTDRDDFERSLAQQVEVEKELTRFGDRVSARRRRLPMWTEIVWSPASPPKFSVNAL